MERLLATRATPFFDEVDHIFFPAGVRGVTEVAPGFRVHEVPGRILPADQSGDGGSASWRERIQGLWGGWEEILGIAGARPPTVVNTGEPFLAGILAREVARRHGVPLVLTLVSNYRLSWEVGGLNPIPFFPAPLSFAIERSILSSADRVHTDCEHYAAYARSRGAPEARVRRLPRYVDPLFYEAEPDVTIWERHQIPDPTPLVYIGRLSPEKYALELADTFLQVVKTDPARHLVVLGGGGPSEDAFLTRIQEGGGAGRLHLLTGLSRPDLFSAMGRAGALLATHAGYALLEAALAGAPVVAYDYEWHPELIRNRETGLLVPFRDARAMAAGALELLKDPVHSRAMGRRLRDEARRGFHPNRHLALLRASYAELLGESTTGEPR